MECYSVLDCSVDVETLNSQGASGKRVNHKRACVQLGRDQHQDLVFRLNNTSYTLKDFKVLDKFKHEGKVSALDFYFFILQVESIFYVDGPVI